MLEGAGQGFYTVSLAGRVGVADAEEVGGLVCDGLVCDEGAPADAPVFVLGAMGQPGWD